MNLQRCIVVFGLIYGLHAVDTGAQCVPQWDTTLGNPGLADGYADPMVPWDSGAGEKLYVGGSFSRIGGVTAESVASYNPATNTWSRMGSRGLSSGFATSIHVFDDGTGEKLYVSGLFDNADGKNGTENLAAWDGSQWSSVGGGVDFAVWALTSGDFEGSPRLYVGGQFNSAGGVPAHGIASWDGQQYRAVGSGVGIGGAFSPYISKMRVWNDGSGAALYCVGRFDTIDGVTCRMIGKWNGLSWSQVGAGLTPPSSLQQLDAITVFDDGTGEALYVAGTEFRINGRSGLVSCAKWNGVEWTPIGQVVYGRVANLIGWNDGDGPKLYFAGTAIPDLEYFARLEGGVWVTAFGGVGGPAIPPSNWPSAFGLGRWGKHLLIGGNFTEVGDDPLISNGLVMLTSCADDCSGRERLSLGCQPRDDGNVNIIAKVTRGTPGMTVTLRLNGDGGTDRGLVLSDRGKGKTKFKNVAPGHAEAQLRECDIIAAIDCP